jgi:hypothetical protein
MNTGPLEINNSQVSASSKEVGTVYMEYVQRENPIKNKQKKRPLWIGCSGGVFLKNENRILFIFSEKNSALANKLFLL